MTDPTPLTPASEALLSELTLDETPEGAASWRRSVVAIEAAVTARVLADVAARLPVALPEMLHRGGWGVPEDGCHQYSITTARDGVTTVREDTTAATCEHASLHGLFAESLTAAILALLTGGPR